MGLRSMLRKLSNLAMVLYLCPTICRDLPIIAPSRAVHDFMADALRAGAPPAPSLSPPPIPLAAPLNQPPPASIASQFIQQVSP